MTISLEAPGIPFDGIDPTDAVQILGPNPDRYDWLALRRTGIGGSEVSTIVGLNSYSSTYELWMDKTGQLPLVDEAASEAAEMGHLLEPVVRDRFAQIHGVTVRAGGTFRSVRWPWMIANPDGLVSDGYGYEGKTCSQWVAHEWKDGLTADHAELQAQWCMAVTGLEGWHVAVLIGGQHNEYRFIHRDPELIDVLVDVSRRFWLDHVIGGEPPEWDGSESATDLLKERHPVSGPGSIADISEDERDEIVVLREKTAAEEKAAKSGAEALKNRVRALIGDNERLMCGDAEIATWKNTGQFNASKFTAAHPDIAAEYTRPVTVEQLDVEGIKRDHPELHRQFRARTLRFK